MKFRHVLVLLLLTPAVSLALSTVLQPHVDVYRGPTEFNGTAAYDLLRVIVSEYSGRVVGTQSDRRIALWLAERFRALGLETHIDEFEAPGFGGTKVRAYNVYAVKKGREDAYIVLIAHHDVVPRTVEGANDNGGGLAVLLELARVLARRDTRLGIVFLSTDAEETGLHGAYRFLETFDAPVVAAISIDMCTWAGHEGVTLYAFLHPPACFSDLGLLYLFVRAGGLGGAARVMAVDLSVLSARLMFIFAGTDSMPFPERGVPGVGIADWPVYPFWHTPEDTLDKTSPTSLEEVGVLVERVVMSIDRWGLPRLGDQYLFVGPVAIYGHYLYAAWLAVVSAVVAAMLMEVSKGGSIPHAIKTFLLSEALTLAISLVSMVALSAARTALPVLAAAVAVTVAAYVLLSRLVLASVDTETLKLTSLIPALAVAAVGLPNPSLALVLLAPTIYAVILAKPISSPRLSLAARVLLPVVAMATPLSVLVAGSAVMGTERLSKFLGYIVSEGLQEVPLLVTALFVLMSLAASSVALATCVVPRGTPENRGLLRKGPH